MALQLEFTIVGQSDCEEIVWTDTTGIYNVSTNPGGWGTPNATTASVTSATLTITDLINDVTYDPVDVTVNSTATIVATDLLIDGLAGGLATFDGYFKFVYDVTAAEVDYSQTVRKLFTCALSCKVKKLALAVDIECNCCTNSCAEDLYRFIEANALYKALQYAALCGTSTTIISDYNSLYDFLIDSDCDNC